MCYFISSLLAKDWVEKMFPDMLNNLKQRIKQNQGNLFFYLLFLRISPILPNWFINIASPLVGIPWHTFSLATLFGLIPANYIHIQTGLKLVKLGTEAENSLSNFIGLFFLGLLALVPTILKRQCENKAKR
jgi:uncharacterized membrane protein YdjX (TVP38/TMEM64 family)